MTDPDPEDDVPRLQSRVAELEAEMDRLRVQNQRLEAKLASNQSYTEELRIQIENLGRKLLPPEQSSQGIQVDLDRGSPSPGFEPETTREHAWNESGTESIADQVAAAASSVVQSQNLVYEETSGLYYDYCSGFYYDAQRGLYYDGTRGIYYRYDYDTKEYVVHATVDLETGLKKKKKNTKRNKILERKRRRSERDEGKDESEDQDMGKSRSPKTEKDVEDQEGEEEEEEEEEEGELDSSESQDSESTDETNGSEAEEEPPKEIPPCIRMVVAQSEIMTRGELFIVTCMGGSVGREGDHDVLLDDIGCSKSHAQITYRDGKFYYQDQGSTNGSTINAHRLKDQEVREIGHGSKIKIGTTDLVCHVHPGIQTCLECEPGLTKPAVVAPQVPIESSEQTRKKAMKAIRKKYGINYANTQPPKDAKDGSAMKYQDRAQLRRKTVGSSHPHAKTEMADTKTSITRKNKGFKMLSQMGWTEGSGLGKAAQGRVEPVLVEQRAERSGLGVDPTLVSTDGAPTRKEKAKQEILKKTQERYEKIT